MWLAGSRVNKQRERSFSFWFIFWDSLEFSRIRVFSGFCNLCYSNKKAEFWFPVNDSHFDVIFWISFSCIHYITFLNQFCGYELPCHRLRISVLCEMETLFPPSYFPTLNFLMQESRSTEWTKEENKKFEKALALYDDNTPERWVKVAAMIPGKSVSDVRRQYRELESDVSDIEAGLVPDPGYLTSSFTLELMENGEFDVYRKRPLQCRSLDQERKKGVPWTEEEHRWEFTFMVLAYSKLGSCFYLVLNMFGYLGNCSIVLQAPFHQYILLALYA